MSEIPKKIHYIWFGKGEKPKGFNKILNSWKENCPDYEIIEWNENNFDVSQNYYCKKFYDKGLYAFASDYARIKILYEYGGIYLDVDMELLKNLDGFLNDKFFIGFQDIFSVGAGIIGSEKNHRFLKDILDIYENKKTRIVIPNLITGLLRKKYNLKKYNDKIQKLNNIIVYPKQYFYPYAYYETKDKIIITEKTYTIHHYDASWLPKVITSFIFPIIGFFVGLKIKKLKKNNKNYIL